MTYIEETGQVTTLNGRSSSGGPEGPYILTIYITGKDFNVSLRIAGGKD